MVNLRDFLKNITCQSECCKSSEVRTNGEGNNIHFSIEVKEPRIIKVKDEETNQPSPSTPPANA